MFYTSYSAKFAPCAFLAARDIVDGYTRVHTLLQPARLVIIHNWTDADLWWSTDGEEDHFPIAAHSEKILDITSNTFTSDMTGIFVFNQGTEFWVKRLEVPADAKGVYVASIYGSETL